jgi:putative transposase
MDWARILAYVTGTVDQELLARNEYFAAENRILKAQLNGRLKLSDTERAWLGEIGHRLGRTALAEVATVARLVSVAKLVDFELGQVSYTDFIGITVVPCG